MKTMFKRIAPLALAFALVAGCRKEETPAPAALTKADVQLMIDASMTNVLARLDQAATKEDLIKIVSSFERVMEKHTTQTYSNATAQRLEFQASLDKAIARLEAQRTAPAAVTVSVQPQPPVTTSAVASTTNSAVKAKAAPVAVNAPVTKLATPESIALREKAILAKIDPATKALLDAYNIKVSVSPQLGGQNNGAFDTMILGVFNYAQTNGTVALYDNGRAPEFYGAQILKPLVAQIGTNDVKGVQWLAGRYNRQTGNYQPDYVTQTEWKKTADFDPSAVRKNRALLAAPK